MSDLLTAEFDNHDAAYALEIPSFGDFRKNLERGNTACLPRFDETYNRPRFRLAHIYEYALLHVLLKNYSKDQAHRLVWSWFAMMNSESRDRSADAANSVQQIDGKFRGYAGRAGQANLDLLLFVYNPEIAFGPWVLDRSGQQEPCYLICRQLPLMWESIDQNQDIVHTPCYFNVVMASGHQSISGALDALKGRFLKNHNGPFTDDYFGFTAINLSKLLGTVDERLAARLAAVPGR